VSQSVGTSSPSRRTSGVVRRSDAVSTSPAVHPFWHSLPRLVGNSSGVISTPVVPVPPPVEPVETPPAATTLIAHWSAQ